jgi:hypothetical protein
MTLPTQPSLPPTTTAEQDVVTAGQRRINIIWEITQAVISIAITAAVIYCEIKNIDAPVLTNAFFLVVSMYYIRTNHSKTGGLGVMPTVSRSGQDR